MHSPPVINYSSNRKLSTGNSICSFGLSPIVEAPISMKIGMQWESWETREECATLPSCEWPQCPIALSRFCMVGFSQYWHRLMGTGRRVEVISLNQVLVFSSEFHQRYQSNTSKMMQRCAVNTHSADGVHHLQLFLSYCQSSQTYLIAKKQILQRTFCIDEIPSRFFFYQNAYPYYWLLLVLCPQGLHR